MSLTLGWKRHVLLLSLVALQALLAVIVGVTVTFADSAWVLLAAVANGLHQLIFSMAGRSLFRRSRLGRRRLFEGAGLGEGGLGEGGLGFDEGGGG